jgi:ATP-binding cassette subfamily B protein
VAQVTSALQSSARGARALLEALGAIFVLYTTSGPLTAVALLVAPIALLLSQRLGARVKTLSRLAAEALAAASGVAEESVLNVRTLKSFVAEERALARYGRRAERAFRLQQRIALHSGLLDGLTRAAGNAGAIAILSLGGALVASGKLTVGALTSFVIYTLFISSALGTLASSYAELKRAEGTGGRLFQILAAKPAVLSPPPQRAAAAALAAAAGGPAALPPPEEHFVDSDSLPSASLSPTPPSAAELSERLAGSGVHLQLDHVSFRFPTRGGLVLNACSIDIRPGEVTALVGPSGGGKSTVASLLQRFYDPEGGSVLLNGVDVRQLDPAWLRSNVAVVSQEPALFDASIARNIALGAPPGRRVTRAQVVAAAQAANAHGFISAFPAGYETRLGERGVSLSGGQRQRLAIARAILKDAPVLILDEATSALDSESEGAVQQALERLAAGRTTLVIAHRFAALRGAESIYVLDGGRVAESGSHEALVAAGGLYARMYRLGRLSGPQTGIRSLAEWAGRVPALLASRMGKSQEAARVEAKAAASP